MKANTGLLFYAGLFLLSAPAYYVPRIMGLHPAEAAVMALVVAVGWVISFGHIESKIQEQEAKQAKEEEELW